MHAKCRRKKIRQMKKKKINSKSFSLVCYYISDEEKKISLLKQINLTSFICDIFEKI